MDPGFNADRVQTLNNLPDDVDPYTHFLAEGQHNGAYTSYGTILRSYDENRDSYLNVIWGGFGVGENSLARI